jgi:DNA anti-recombination protein RmuC
MIKSFKPFFRPGSLLELGSFKGDFTRRFREHFDDISSGLEKANNAYNKAAASFQSRVRPAGERLAELGGGLEGKNLAEVLPIESTLQKLL